MMGAKNHMVVLPDANRDATLNALVGAAAGAAGQRCMAISVVVFVGDSSDWIDDLTQRMAAARPGAWDDLDVLGYGYAIEQAKSEPSLHTAGRSDSGSRRQSKTLHRADGFSTARR